MLTGKFHGINIARNVSKEHDLVASTLVLISLYFLPSLDDALQSQSKAKSIPTPGQKKIVVMAVK